jgi:hypothetical protein
VAGSRDFGRHGQSTMKSANVSPSNVACSSEQKIPVRVGIGIFNVLVALSIGVIHTFAQNVRLSPDDSLDTVIAKAVDARPTPRQIAWQRDVNYQK